MEWPILSWLTKGERTRREDEAVTKLDLDDETEFDPLLHCGHRYAEQVIPIEEVDKFFAWTLTKSDDTPHSQGDPIKYLQLIREHTSLELIEAYAMRRTLTYIMAEETGEDE